MKTTEGIRKGAIQTVCGVIDGEELGFCHAHEHLFIRKGYPATIVPSLIIDDFDLTRQEVQGYRAAGGRSIVDAQPVGCGRMASCLARLSQETKVHIVAATGFHKTTYYPPDHWIHSADEGQLAELFMSELVEGMFEDGDQSWPRMRGCSRAGAIKVAIDGNGPDRNYKRLLKAAAVACVESGFPLLCHTEAGRGAIELVEFVANIGVDPGSVILCHLDRDASNLAYHKEVAKSGAYLEYDTIGRPKYHSDEDEIELIVGMIEAGYSSQLLFGLDTTRDRLRSYGGKPGLDHISVSLLPMLRRRGVPDSVIEQIMIANPSVALACRC